MENKEVTILLNAFSNSIFVPNHCETCKCFNDLTKSEKAIYRYNCFIKEGDIFCDIAQSKINALMEAENITSLEDYIKRLKGIKYENRKNT